MRAPRRLRSCFVLCPLSFVLVLCGCHGGNCDLVEAELRTREMQLADLRAERDNLVAHNQALQREVCSLRGGSPYKMSPEEASQTYTLRSLVLGRQTGGLDEDGQPGDEALQVQVEPRDGDGHTIKAPGTLRVHAAEITTEGLKNPLCSWELSADELRRTWKNGLFSTGYSLVLPWKVWPSNEKVRVVAQFTLSDGRVFEAEKDVMVRLVPAAHRKPTTGPPPAVDGPPLPPPRKLEGGEGFSWRSVLGRPAPAPAAPWWKQPEEKTPLIQVIEFRAPVPLPTGS
jgi:hypothetical protein